MLDADTLGFAKQLQDSMQQGGFDPFAMLMGTPRYHSVFVAPLTRGLKRDVEQFLTTGDGPLQAVVEQFARNGLDRATARTRASEMFRHARGLCVVVSRTEQGVACLPTLFYGHMREDYTAYVVDLAQGLQGAEELPAHLRTIALQFENGAVFPRTVVGPEKDPADYWLDLAEDLVQGLDESTMPMAPSARDLAETCLAALDDCEPDGRDGDRLYAAARCALICAALDRAAALIEDLCAGFELDEEDAILLVDHCQRAGCEHRDPLAMAGVLEAIRDEVDPELAASYEFNAAWFRLLAAGQADATRLIQVGELVAAADRKSLRHDLTHEPIWRLAVDDPGPVLEVGEAAERLDRSPTFVAKRLERGTLPGVFVGEDGDALRIPERGLDAWRNVLKHFACWE